MPWLMKAEPDSRIEKGKDVKFSIDDFEKLGESPWDGVRSHEAKKIMKEKMKLGDKVLFYHSNTKVPGVYGLATVCKEGYPDHTAFDETHPYYDPKSSKENPTWFMVSVKFVSRLEYPPTLALVKHLATLSSLPDEIRYIGEIGFKAIGSMQLVNRGRLSVQPVTEEAYEAIVELGTRGGWGSLLPSGGGGKPKSKAPPAPPNSGSGEGDDDKAPITKAGGVRKRKGKAVIVSANGKNEKGSTKTKTQSRVKEASKVTDEGNGDGEVVEEGYDQSLASNRKIKAVEEEENGHSAIGRRSKRLKK